MRAWLGWMNRRHSPHSSADKVQGRGNRTHRGWRGGAARTAQQAQGPACTHPLEVGGLLVEHKHICGWAGLRAQVGEARRAAEIMGLSWSSSAGQPRLGTAHLAVAPWIHKGQARQTATCAELRQLAHAETKPPSKRRQAPAAAVCRPQHSQRWVPTGGVGASHTVSSTCI